MKLVDFRGVVDKVTLPDIRLRLNWPSQVFHFSETGVVGLVGALAFGLLPGLYAGVAAGLVKELSSMTMWLMNQKPEDLTANEALTSDHMKDEYKDLLFHTLGAVVGAFLGVIL